MGDINKQQQAAVAAHQNPQPQQSAAQQHTQMQQQVDGQTIQVQIAHDGSEQMHTQGNQGIQNLQSPPSLAPIHSQAGATTITTMSTGPPQQMTDWPAQGRLQVIQQPLQNPTYIQPVYNAQGQLIVPGNIALHPGSMNQPIQVIAAGKPFQAGQMPHMLTAQGKSIVQGQTASFPGYATIPTSAGNQTLVISPLGVIGQTNILSPPQNKPQDMQKMMSKATVGNGNNTNSAGNNGNNGNMKSPQAQQQSVSIGNLVSSQAQGITTQAQAIIQPQIISPIQYTCNTQQQRGVQGATPTMQFAPWQATFGPANLPQGLTWAPGIQSPALLTQGSQIFIRNSQPEQAGMFIQNAQPTALPQANPIPGQQLNKNTQGVDVATNVQPKNAITKAFSTILPNSVGQQQMKTSAGVGTQTGQTQTGGMHQSSNLGAIKMGPKIRAKTVCRMPTMATGQKADAANQTKPSVQLIQPKLVLSNIISPQDAKVIKPGMQSTSQAAQQPQPLTQIQQMQNIFPEPVDQKPPGQLMMSNGVGSGGSVVSMPPGQMAPIVGNMIVQAVPGIPNLTIPTGQAVPEMLAGQTTIKQENPDQKDGRNMEDGTFETEPEPSTSTDHHMGGETKMEEKPKGQLMNEGKDKEEENKENKDVDKKPNDKDLGQQKATMMVKPQVLTHVIEGFVIQESSEPFPVNRGCMDGLIRRMPSGESSESGEPPVKKPTTGEGKDRDMATCEHCGKRDLKSKFKKSKRFCSLACARREGDKPMPGGSNDMNDSSAENVPQAAEATGDNQGQSSSNQESENRVNPLQWSVAEVCEFIRNLPGCADYVEDFALQDIDGEALMLLKPDHLMTVMSMKLGPAVKIIAKIDTMRNGDGNPAA